jgi:hypothetical protein
MKQSIVSFNQDDVGDWVAELACGHARHVRHEPPWQNYAWVNSEQGRQQKIGQLIECRLCDQQAKHNAAG